VEYRSLGKSGIEVSTVAMGCWAIAGDWVWGDQEEQESIATVHAALDLGVNLLDTAEGYGEGTSEIVLGRALAGRRHEAVIATKVSSSDLSSVGIRRACEGSLRRLNTDTIDLYQIHWPNWAVPIEESMGTLELLRQEGKIRAIGVCNFGTRDQSELLAIGRCETNQLPYSLLWRAIEFQIQQQCVDEGVGILCYSPLAQGLLTGKFRSADDVPDTRARTRHFSQERPFVRHGEAGQEAETFAAIDRIRAICDQIERPMAQVALAWVLAQPGVTSVLAGARHPRQMRENVQAADLTLPPEVTRKLTTATDALKGALLGNPDQYQGVSRFR
jgi:aryl-alcohol dehydrogenase-like predicted oxidoreductase